MDIDKILKQTKEALDAAVAEKKRGEALLNNLGPAIVETLRPILNELALNSKLSKNELLDAISNIKIEVPKADVPKAEVNVNIPEPKVTVNIPEIKIPEFKEIKLPKIIVPEPKVTVNVPPIKIPDLKWPEAEMPIKGWVQLMGIDLQHPLPVQLRDENGKPVNISGGSTILGGGGGKMDFFTIKAFSQSAFAELVNPDGRLKVEMPTGAAGLTDAELRASSIDVQQASGANWSVNVNGALNSVLATGATLHHAADDGDAPVKVGGVAVQANPTAVDAGDRVKFTADDLGRQLTRPVQVRDLIATAYASFSTGTEATLLAGVAATYLDLIYVLASNASTVAVGIDIRPSTAGSIVMHLEIPANGVVGVSLPVPIPQQATGDGTGGTWTVDLPDITGTTVYVSALFSKEV